jgi:hypothetical protein
MWPRRKNRAADNQACLGEHSRPGCGSSRPRDELRARIKPLITIFVRREEADDEGVVGCARGGRAPKFLAVPRFRALIWPAKNVFICAWFRA